MYRALVWPVVADSLARSVAPIAALDAAYTCKVPAAGS
jgi:hypothetical protein